MVAVLLVLLCRILPMRSPAPLRFSSVAVPIPDFVVGSFCRFSLIVVPVFIPLPLNFLHNPGKEDGDPETSSRVDGVGEDPDAMATGLDKWPESVMEFVGDSEMGVVEGVETASSVESPRAESSVSAGLSRL